VSALRLDRLLANMGYGSRREIQAMAKAGRIKLDGAEITDADRKIVLVRDLPEHLTIGGQPVDPPPGLALMIHKPLGVTCSHKEAGGLVYELLPQRWLRRDPVISTVGRLDKETSGLLLMTDDGALLHQIISPRRHVAKRYQVGLARPLRGDEAAIFASGELMLEGEDKPLEPAVLEVASPTTAALTITEGRYHQVRRMFAAVGNHVEALHRDRVGGLDLPADLAPGEWRLLNEDQIASVLSG